MNKNNIRIIPKLDIKNGTLIKGIGLEGLRVLGDPYDFAKKYYEDGADEILYMDNVATLYGTNNLTKFVKKTAKDIFIPLTVGGGIKNLKNIEKLLVNGADKVSINSEFVVNKKFIEEAVKNFGSSTIVATIESNKIKNEYFITTSNGRDLYKKNPVQWAKELEDTGVGEIILTSVNNEGLKSGFDVPIIKKISEIVKIPVIAHGGCGNIDHIINLIKKTNVTGVALASILHYASIKKKQNTFNLKTGNTNFLQNAHKNYKNIIKKIKNELRKNGIKIRYE
mgnify:CR=1 FL=1